MIIYTEAFSIKGSFPKELILLKIRQQLREVIRLIPDYFEDLRSLIHQERSQGRMSERGSEMRVAETYRDQPKFGSVPTLAIEGVTNEGVPLLISVGELMAVIKILKDPNFIDASGKEKAIPNLKDLIFSLHPDVNFDDITSE